MKKTLVAVSLFISAVLCLQAQSAQELRSGAAPVAGNLNNGGEIWYSVRAAGAGFLTVETSGDIDTFLEAHDSRRNLIAADDDGGEGLNARVTVYAARGSTFLFKLRGYDSEVSGPYSIWANIEAVPAATELRPGTPRQGNIQAGRRDWYSVRAAGNGYLTVRTSGGVMDTYMEVYDSRYNLLDEDDDSGGLLNARIEILVERNQTYFFAVRAYSSELSGPYSISANFEPLPPDARNTQRSRAAALRLGDDVPVFFRSNDESRWYRFEVPRNGGSVHFQTTGNTDTLLLLYDSQGNLIAEDDDSGEGLNAYIQEDLSAGTYFIEVKTYWGATGRSTLHTGAE